jgi:hypothetical protein
MVENLSKIIDRRQRLFGPREALKALNIEEVEIQTSVMASLWNNTSKEKFMKVYVIKKEK